MTILLGILIIGAGVFALVAQVRGTLGPTLAALAGK